MEGGFWAQEKSEGPVSLTPETPFLFPFKRLPSRLDAPMLSLLNLEFFVQLVDACGYVSVKLFRLFFVS